jgi:hypothetical protein
MKSFFSELRGFIRTKPEPDSWFSACKKYMESVHKPANVSVITTVAEDPEKPVNHAIMRQ